MVREIIIKGEGYGFEFFQIMYIVIVLGFVIGLGTLIVQGIIFMHYKNKQIKTIINARKEGDKM